MNPITNGATIVHYSLHNYEINHPFKKFFILQYLNNGKNGNSYHTYHKNL